MSKSTIGTGDAVSAYRTKTNSNVDEIYAAFGDGTDLDTVGGDIVGTTGSQTLTNKTIKASGGNQITVSDYSDLAGGTALTINSDYFDDFSANRTLTFSGTPAADDTVRLNLNVTTACTVTFPSSNRQGTDGATTSIAFPVGDYRMVWQYIDGAWSLSDNGPATITDTITWTFAEGANDDQTIVLNSAFAFTIVKTTTKCTSGTATYTFKIGATPLGGTANSVSLTEQEQAHASANSVAAGDDVILTRSADATCVNGTFTIEYTRTV